MAIPNKYNPIGEGSVASYNYSEIASGTGYRTYYPEVANLSGAFVYFLSSQRYDTGDNVTSANIATTSYTMLFDKDFDLTYNLPVVVNGKVLLNVTTALEGTASGQTRSYVLLNVYHVTSGGTETLLASGHSEEHFVTTGTTDYSKRNLVIADITTQRKFKRGETLRVNIQFYGNTTGGGAGGGTTGWIYHDPNGTLTVPFTDADGNTPASTIYVDVPYKIDL